MREGGRICGTPLTDQGSFIITLILHTTTPRVCMAFGDFAGHGTNPNPLRTFASTKHSPLIGRDAPQSGQWATSVISTQNCPKRADNPGGVAYIYIYIYISVCACMHVYGCVCISQANVPNSENTWPLNPTAPRSKSGPHPRISSVLRWHPRHSLGSGRPKGTWLTMPKHTPRETTSGFGWRLSSEASFNRMHG